MLTAIRSRVAGWAAKILFALLIAAFAMWGVTDYLTGGQERTIAKVGDLEISEREFSDRFGYAFDTLRRQVGQGVTRDLAVQLGLPQQVMSELVQEKLYTLEADEIGLVVSDESVREAIRRQPAFQDALGRFDQDRFRQVLFSAGFSEQRYVDQLRRDVVREKIAEAVAVGARAPRPLAESVYRFQGETRAADVILVPFAAFGDLREPEESELRALYDRQTERYRAPEYRELTVAYLSPDMMAEELGVTEEAIREAYEAGIGRYRSPETRTVTQLLFRDEAAAQGAYERIAGGEGFEAVAADARMAGGVETVDIGEVQQGELYPQQLEQAVFALAEPGVTPPVRSPVGWHVIRVSAIEPGETRPLDEVREEVKAELVRQVAVDDLIRLSHRLEDEIMTGAGLEAAAGAVDARLIRVPAVDRRGRAPDGSEVPDLPRDPAFLSTAFELVDGEESLLRETRDGGYFVVRVDSITSPAVRPFADVRDRVTSDWRGEERRRLADEKAAELADRLRRGDDVAAVAEEHGLVHASPSGFDRSASDPGGLLPRQLTVALFAASRGETTTVAGDEGVYAARLTAIEVPDPAQAADDVRRVASALRGSMQSELLEQFGEALRSRYRVEINEAAMRDLY